MAKRRWLVQAVYVEKEGTYLTPETLEAADAVRLVEPATMSDPEPLDDGNREGWPHDGAIALPDLPPLGLKATVSGRTPLVGADTAYDDSSVYPAVHDLMLASQCTATVDTTPSSESVIYKPGTQDTVGITLGLVIDGQIHKVIGAVVDWTIVLEFGRRAILEWTATGLYEAPTDSGAEASLTGDYSAWINASVVKNAAFTWNSYSALASRFSFSLGNNIVMLPSVNQDEVGDEGGGIAGFGVPTRAPTFEFDPESPLVSTYDFYGDRDARTERALSFGPVGATQYNMITVTAPAAVIRQATPGDRDGWKIVTVSGALFDSTIGNDDAFELKFS